MNPREIQEVIKADAFNRASTEESAWLRSEANRGEARRVLRMMVANIEAQLGISDTDPDPDLSWRARTERLHLALRARLVEFEDLCGPTDAERLREAIEAHREARQGYGQAADCRLWSVLDDST